MNLITVQNNVEPVFSDYEVPVVESSFDLKSKLEQRRESLTIAEIEFLQELSAMAIDDEQRAILDANLSDPDLFFTTKNNSSATSVMSCQTTGSVGSARRIQKVQTRRANKTSALKRAAMKVMAVNRFSALTGKNDVFSAPSSRRNSLLDSTHSTRRGSALDSNPSSRRGSTAGSAPTSRRGSAITKGSAGSSRKNSFCSPRTSTTSAIKAIMEDLSWVSSSDTEDSDDVTEVEEEDLEEYSEAPNLRSLLTRRASQNVYGGEGFEIGVESIFTQYARHYDPWEVTTDPEGKPFEFHIIGTDGQDMDAQPHVLSPPQMHSLQEYLPFSKRGESFWLKYSMVRDGACKTSFLKHLRSDEYTVMAMETLDGEVFGAFTASPWTIQHGYFGTAESFVWRLKTPREDDENLDLDLTYEERAKLERDIDVFKYSFSNNVAQICTHDRIAVGGGTTSFQKMVADGSLVEPNQFGFAISFDGSSMLEASSSPSVTFNSPGLSKLHSDGSKFELLNLEVWSLTPCISVEEAHQLACQKLFLERNSRLQRATTV